MASEKLKFGFSFKSLAAFFVLGDTAFFFLGMLGNEWHGSLAKSEWSFAPNRLWTE